MVEAPVLGAAVEPERAAPAGAAAPRPLRLLVLANKAHGLAPGQRFRFEQWAPRLARDHAITLDLAPFESPRLSGVLYKPGHYAAKAALVSLDFLRRARVLPKARDYDGILLFREAALIGPAIYERLLTWIGKPIIYDFDDSIWSEAQEKNNGFFSRLHFVGKTSTLCRIASAVTPGNEFLADYARRRNGHVVVMPTSIELDDYPVVPEAEGERPFVICWTGSTSTLAHFEHAREALETLARRMPVTVKVICNKPPERPIAGAEMRFVPWTQEGEAREIGDSHVGIMPLPDNEVTRGKCGLKALQCMATGRPVVVSPVGMNVDLIRDGENGFLASTSSDYVEALTKLAASPDLRERMGAAGRRTVEQSYSAEAVAAKFADVVRSVIP
jgi:glycosyltransferase involved in cell wall biosynthesis